MTLVAPIGLIAAGLLGPLVLWYVLRSRRPRRVVASTLLFRDEHETASAAVPWQPFSPDRTFWLIALAVLLGALALARPAVAVPAEVSDHTIIVIDASASMQAATDGGLSRLEVARERAAELIDRAGDGRVVSLVESGTNARVLADALPASAAASALNRLTGAATVGAMDEALTLASALIRPAEPTVLHLLTDGGIPPGDAALAPAGTIVTIIGEAAPNLAIGAVRAVPLGGGNARVVVQVDSFADLATDARVVISHDGRQVGSATTTVTPRGRADVEVEVAEVDATTTVLDVALIADVAGPATDTVADALAYDNRARVVVPARQAIRVLHVGPENVYLDAALAALPDVAVARRPAVPPQISDADVLVIDRVALPDGLTVPVLAISPTAVPPDMTLAGRRDLPTITTIDSSDPVLADVDLTGLAVAAMTVVDAPALRALVDGPGGPLLLSGRTGQTSVVLVPFALADSNLPLQVALPVLLSNTVQHLAGPSADVPVVAGADRPLPIPPGPTATLIGPDGQTITLDGNRPSATLGTPGVWQVTYDGPVPERAPSVVAVNPDVRESNLDPTEVTIGRTSGDPEGAAADGGDLPAATDGEGTGDVAPRLALAGDTALVTEGRIELWRWFLLATLAAVALEVALTAWQSGRKQAVA